MHDILKTIIDVENECAEKIAAEKNDHDMAINNLNNRIEIKRIEEKKRIANENSERFKKEINAAEKEIERELSDMKIALGRLRDNKELCHEVQNKIISILF